jgi:hypothetical protein
MKMKEDRITELMNSRAIFKFAIVRHPWTRLISSFIAKYQSRCKSNRQCFRDDFFPSLSTVETSPVSLTELLALMIHNVAQGRPNDRHFMPTSEICSIGSVPYDFIGDVENTAHMDFLLTRIRTDKPLSDRSLQEKHPDAEYSTPSCDRHTVDLAAAFYADDLRLYGFTMAEAYETCGRRGVAKPPTTTTTQDPPL